MVWNADDNLTPRNEMGRGVKAALTIFLFLVSVLVVFLIFPLQTASLPGWLPALQGQLGIVLAILAPFAIVGLLGGMVAVAEIASTFHTYPREALRTRWAWILIVVNVLAAIIALLVAQVTMPDMDTILQVLAVGVGFQALIRTRFVLAKQIGGPDKNDAEVSLNLGWLYDQFQHLCRTQIDLELMNNRRTAVTRLLEFYPSLAELYDIAWYTIISRATLSPDEEKARQDELQKLIDPKAPENFARTNIALMILENGGQAYVELLLDQAMAAAKAGAPVPTTPEQVVRQMVDKYTLDELVQLTNQLTASEEIRKWVSQAARPSSEASQAQQKASIAHFLVQQVGLDAVKRVVADAASVRDA
jgi:hypothetical protein